MSGIRCDKLIWDIVEHPENMTGIIMFVGPSPHLCIGHNSERHQCGAGPGADESK